jgi:hypothetical protein
MPKGRGTGATVDAAAIPPTFETSAVYGEVMKKKVGRIVVLVGAITCLLMASFWIANAIYWWRRTGSTLDRHITDYELAPVVCIAGVFFFTRVVAKLFDV